jgi:hypothetical protein
LHRLTNNWEYLDACHLQNLKLIIKFRNIISEISGFVYYSNTELFVLAIYGFFSNDLSIPVRCYLPDNNYNCNNYCYYQDYPIWGGDTILHPLSSTSSPAGVSLH